MNALFLSCFFLLAYASHGFLMQRTTMISPSPRLFVMTSDRSITPTTTSYVETDQVVQQQIDDYLLAANGQQQIYDYLQQAETTSTNKDDEQKNLMEKIKDSGVAGIVSFAVVQFLFWTLSAPLVIVAFYKLTGHLPDFSDNDDNAKLGAEAFTFLNIARLAAPFRIGMSLSLVPWVQANILDPFNNKN